MKEFLKRVGLLVHLTTELSIERKLFIQRFQTQIDLGNSGMFSGFHNVFSPGKSEYKGTLSNEGFKIHRRRAFFDVNMNMAVATGSFQQRDDTLIIETEINGFNGMMIPFYILITIFYIVFILAFAFSVFGGPDNGELMFAIPFIILHAGIMYGGPYLMMRRSARRLKHELEREFFYMTKAPSS